MILQEQDSAFKIVARGVDKKQGRNVMIAASRTAIR
jgi:hypothetical protein